LVEDKKLIGVKVEIFEDDDNFEPFCSSYMSPDEAEEYNEHDIKPVSVNVERFPDDVGLDDFLREYERGQKRKKYDKNKYRNEPARRRTCEYCGKIFSRRDYMLIHCNKQHKSASGIYFKCDVCKGQKSFKMRARLEEHMREAHLKNLDDKEFIYYECNICKNTFMDVKDFTSHSLYVHEKEILKPRKIKSYRTKGRQAVLQPIDDRTCKICKKSFTRHDSMIYHMKTVHRWTGNVYYCDKCEQIGSSKSFNIKAKLQEHLLVDHLKIIKAINDDQNYYECEVCYDSYLKFDELQTHSIFVHSKPLYRRDSIKKIKRKIKEDPDLIDSAKEELGQFVCELCPESFNKEHKLIDHRMKDHNLGYKCLKCKIDFNTRKDLTFHNHIHVDFARKLAEEEIVMKYECILCAFKSYQESDLYQHLPCHVNEFALNTTGKLLVCNNCSTILKDYESLHSHVGVHNEMVTHECLKCNKKFPMGNKLLRHLMKHKVNEKLKCTYDGCNYYCATKPQMKDHVRHKHLEQVIHLCPICGQSFGQQGSLRNHIKNIHDKTNHIYQCNMCPKVFRVPSHLRNHQAVHTTEFTFKCEHPGCTKIFRAKRNLQIHARFHNRDQLNYKWNCEFCERKFLTKDALKRHTYSHTKGKELII
jgi:hypothetical protein